MILSSMEKKAMREAAEELRKSIMKRARARNIEIVEDILIDFEEIEDKFDIHAKRPLFSFDWQRSRKSWDTSKKFVSRRELAKRKRDFTRYLDKS